ncbi:MAG TPA: hypothetical protein VEL31_20585 [Ktedonobacteraceae bacterium]|nr:hypothetical protein [Ktedonobacteraceae bacterium]
MQPTASAKEQTTRQQHRRQRRVLQGTNVSILAVFRAPCSSVELQDGYVPDTHSRLGACLKAVEDGYQQGYIALW